MANANTRTHTNMFNSHSLYIERKISYIVIFSLMYNITSHGSFTLTLFMSMFLFVSQLFILQLHDFAKNKEIYEVFFCFFFFFLCEYKEIFGNSFLLSASVSPFLYLSLSLSKICSVSKQVFLFFFEKRKI